MPRIGPYFNPKVWRVIQEAHGVDPNSEEASAELRIKLNNVIRATIVETTNELLQKKGIGTRLELSNRITIKNE